MLETINRKVEHLRFMDPISDFLYPLTQSFLSYLLMRRLGVLETWVLVSRRLENRFYKSWSWSWSWNPQVSVSVLVLGLATIKTRFSSLMKREIVRLPPLLLWNGYLATVVCWCGLEQG